MIKKSVLIQCFSSILILFSVFAIANDNQHRIISNASEITIRIGDTAGGKYKSRGPKTPGLTGSATSMTSADGKNLSLNLKSLDIKIHTASGRSQAKDEKQRKKDDIASAQFATYIPKMTFSFAPTSIKGNKINGNMMGAYAFAPFDTKGKLTMGPIFSGDMDLQTRLVRDNDGIYMVFKGRLEGRALPRAAKIALLRFGKNKSIEVEGRILLGDPKKKNIYLKRFRAYEKKHLDIDSLKFPKSKMPSETPKTNLNPVSYKTHY